MRRAWLVLVLVVPLSARAHDVSVDVSGSLITTSQNNPRAGGFGLMASGGWDVGDTVSLFTNLGYTRDLPTRAGMTGTSGSNVFLAGLGVMWLPTDNLMAMLTVTGSPPSLVKSATTVSFRDPFTREPRTVDVVVDSRTWTLGALWTGSWMQTPGNRPWSSMVDVLAGATWYDVTQRLELPPGPAPQTLGAQCAADPSAYRVCPLVNGATTPLLQVRLGGGYTGTLLDKTDFGLEVLGYLYDRDPSDVGYFSVMVVGRGLELGNGVPVLPLAISVRPSVLHRFSRVSLKLSYQYGLYASGQGANHVGALRMTVRLGSSWRLQATVTGQVDRTSAGWGNPGGTAVLGTTVVF
ncbi:MAG: hypothetical protein AB1730_07660 [Myxococcota bacterium]|jgi:hypothetical protein